MSHAFLKFPRNIYLLSISQIIGMSATTIVSLLSGIIGAQIAPTSTLSTLPSTTMILGVAIITIPAALLMKKIGRKNGFILSSLIASLAALLTAFAVSHNNFILLCIGTFLLGTNGAFVQQYRFGAIESVSKNIASRAVGFLLLAGILSGILGPEIAKQTKDIFSLPEYTGPFVVLAALFAAAAFLLAFLKTTKIEEEKTQRAERSLRSIIVQPHFFIAVLAAATGYGVMTLIMTASPIYLHTMSHFSIDSIVFIVQSHVIAMFFPSLFTGILIQRIGVFHMLLAGLGSLCVAVFLATHAHSMLPYWAALSLLGVGWNFLYISSTVLLAESYTHLERFKTQGVNDFVVFMSQVLASFFAGTVLFSGGWINLNLLTLPLISVAFLIFLFNRKNLSRA